MAAHGTFLISKGGAVLTILGPGAFGLALASVAQRKNTAVKVWGRAEDLAVPLPFPLEDLCTLDLNEALAGSKLVVVAVPAQAVRSVLHRLKRVENLPPLAMASKGVEGATGAFMGDICAETLPHVPYGVLSGPNLAKELFHGKPAWTTVASGFAEVLALAQEAFEGPAFRIDGTDDVLGVQTAGALKNVYAVLCGVLRGLHVGENALAAFMARAFQELVEFGVAFGARPETFWTASAGLGDFILTCGSLASRNVAYGVALGSGAPLPTLLSEGVLTVEPACKKADAQNLSVPYMQALRCLLDGTVSLETCVKLLNC